MVRESELVEVTAVVSVCRDPKDDKFLELALSGEATHIISGCCRCIRFAVLPSSLRRTLLPNVKVPCSLHPMAAPL